MDTLTIAGAVMSAYVVYLICKKCWMSTKHDVFKDEAAGTVTYRCVKCGFQWKEKKNDE